MTGLHITAMAQTTVTFKPGPVIGEDAKLFTTYNCTLSGQPSPSEFINDGNSFLIDIGDWTFTGAGCQRGTARSLIRFRELNTIPPGMHIVSAELIFYGLTSTEFPQGNSTYPGSPLSNNIGWVKLIPGGFTSAWNEATVDFSSRPTPYGSTAFGGWVTLPASGTRYDWNTSIDVTDYVQRIVTELAADPTYGNNGFMIELQTEAHYRSMIFASSDFADSTRWPELEVTYAECDADFTYCVSSDDHYNVSFSANTPGSVLNVWLINGLPEAFTPNTQYNFWSEGTYQVCLYRSDNSIDYCMKCVDICISDDFPSKSTKVKTDNYDIVTVQDHENSKTDKSIVSDDHNSSLTPKHSSLDGLNTIKNSKARRTECDPHFTYCINTEDPLKVSFAANYPGSIYNVWTIDAVFEQDAPTYEHTFSSYGNHYVGFDVYDAITGDCSHSLMICLEDNTLLQKHANSDSADKGVIPLQAKYIAGDDPFLVKTSNITITPNPAHTTWNIEFFVSKIGEADIILYDLTGKKITSQKVILNEGKNSFIQSADKVSSGIYFIEVKGESFSLKGKVIKN